eukprot:scaffold222452_cov39-Prasinocladus_malaysianus.AAC.2
MPKIQYQVNKLSATSSNAKETHCGWVQFCEEPPPDLWQQVLFTDFSTRLQQIGDYIVDLATKTGTAAVGGPGRNAGEARQPSSKSISLGRVDAHIADGLLDVLEDMRSAEANLSMATDPLLQALRMMLYVSGGDQIIDAK